MLPAAEVVVRPHAVAIGARVGVGYFARATALQVLGGRATENGGPTAAPDLVVGVESTQQMLVQHDLYGFHVYRLST